MNKCSISTNDSCTSKVALSGFQLAGSLNGLIILYGMFTVLRESFDILGSMQPVSLALSPGRYGSCPRNSLGHKHPIKPQYDIFTFIFCFAQDIYSEL